MFYYGNLLNFNFYMPMNIGAFYKPLLFQAVNPFTYFQPFKFPQVSLVSDLTPSSIFKPTPSETRETNGAKLDTFTRTTSVVSGGSSVGARMATKARSYVGVVNSTAEGNRLFSPKGYQNTQWYRQHGRWGWCCDFAVSCARDTLGSRYPQDMITSSPAGLAQAAGKHNAYLSVPSANKNAWLASNVKPGDIIYMKGKGDSGKHIAVVDSVDSNGNIKAISGNSGGKVKAVNYNVNTSGIYGFVSLDRLAA